MKKIVIYILLIGIYSIPKTMFGQVEPDEIANSNDEFENYFFESIKQKGIENYDKAIEALERCKGIQPENEVVYFELGKNYLSQKNYKNAYDNFERATKINPKNRWAWVGMYDVCYETNDFNKSIVIVEKLIEFKVDYKEDLVSLYMKTQQFDKALELINELNETIGKSEKRELYKADILRDIKYQGSERADLLEKIKKNPKEESNYVDLIYLYSKSNQEEKALEVAKQLEKEIPTSDWAQVSLFKFHITNNDGKSAVKSMTIVFSSDKIDKRIKHRILNEFLIFSTNNQGYEKDLEKAITFFENDKEIKVAKEIGKFYQKRSDWNNASKYYEKHLTDEKDDMEVILLLLQSYTKNSNFDKLNKISEEQIQYFPTQPQLYYYNGLANNQLKNYKKAKDILESGIDFVIENIDLEINFNIQLGEAYNGLGNANKKEQYFIKANELLSKIKK